MTRDEARRILDQNGYDRLVSLVGVSMTLPSALDCGDNSCRSPTRGRGGMRTNGGCRCNPIEIAAAHVALARAILDAPSTMRAVRDLPETEER